MNKPLRDMSQAERLSTLPKDVRDQLISKYTEKELEALKWDWNFWGRPKQLPPSIDWRTWLLIAGRGFGKTRTGVHWVHSRAISYPNRWCALVARTPTDARDYMIEGPGGFLRNIHPDERPVWQPSKKRLTWKNGSWATIYSDDEPDQLRGFSGDSAWLDEFAKFKNPKECWDNLQFGMREASTDHPRQLITTTPRPLELLIQIMQAEGTVTVAGSSYENRSNLDPEWFSKTIEAYEGTRLGRQEIHAEILMDLPNALWSREDLDWNRVKPEKFELMKERGLKLLRVVVGVDPSGSEGSSKKTKGRNERDEGDDIGICVAALASDGNCYVLADRSCNLSPEGWGKEVVKAYKNFSGDKVVAERNFGGAMVEFVIATVDDRVPIKMVTASRGKIARAEPVASLYEQGKVRHVGMFSELEDQLLNFAPGGYVGTSSPDRADAVIWAITELMLEQTVGTTGVVHLKGGFY